jgi:hypothetical protein
MGDASKVVDISMSLDRFITLLLAVRASTK